MTTAFAPPSRAAVIAALLVVYVVWGSTYFAIRIALAAYPPILMPGIRFLAAGLLLFTVLRLRGMQGPTISEWIAGGKIGLLMVGANSLVAAGEQTVSSSVTALMVGAVSLWVALMGGLYGNWPTRREWIGLAVGFSGIALLNIKGDLHSSPIGALFLLISTLAWSFGSVYGRHLTHAQRVNGTGDRDDSRRRCCARCWYSFR